MTDYSRADMQYAVRLGNRGYDVDMIFRALATKPSGRRDPGSLKYQRLMDTKGRDVADAYARQTAEKAIAFIANNPRIIDRTDALVRITERSRRSPTPCPGASTPALAHAGHSRRRSPLLSGSVDSPSGCHCGSGARRAART